MRGRGRVWVPLAVVGVLLAVAAAAFLANRALPARERLEPGTVIEFGGDRRASVTVGEDWWLDRSETSLDLQVTLVHEGTTVVLDAVQYPSDDVPPETMWEGMSRLLDTARYSGVGVELGEPEAFATPNAADALRGDLRIGDSGGFAFVLPSADRAHAVTGRALTTEASGSGDDEAVARLIETVTITGGNA